MSCILSDKSTDAILSLSLNQDDKDYRMEKKLRGRIKHAKKINKIKQTKNQKKKPEKANTAKSPCGNELCLTHSSMMQIRA